jgi:MFS family permease
VSPQGRNIDRFATRALMLAVAVVLADSAIVTLALPDILRELGAEVGEVAWVLMAFNLALAVAAVPAARLCERGDPARWCTAGVVAFAAASTACALAPSLEVLIVARVLQAFGGAVVLVAGLELLVALDGTRGAARWAGAGVAGAALGPALGGLLTEAFAWQSIFVVQVPAVLAALPAAWSLRGGSGPAPPGPSRPHVRANAALALLSAALTAALFLLVLMLVEAWQRSPAVAALTVTVLPVAALAARPVARAVKAGERAEVIAGAILIAGGLLCLAFPPGAELVWTLAPQALIGLGLGLTIDPLTHVALRDRMPRVLHGGWTIAARHAGVVAGLAILTPVFTADLRAAREPAQEAIAGLVLDAPLAASDKIALAEGLGVQLERERGRVPDLSPAFARVPAPALERALEDQLERAATRAFRDAFLVAALLAALALIPLWGLRGP